MINSLPKRPSRRHRAARAVVVATMGSASVLFAMGFVACEGFGVMPGGDVSPDAGGPGTASSAFYGGLPCIGTCTADPGSRPVTQAECNAANGLDRLVLISFDATNSDGNPIARNMYMYADGTAEQHAIFGSPTMGLARSDKGWEAESERTTFSFTTPADLCGQALPVLGEKHADKGANYAFHIAGGYIRGTDGNFCDRSGGVAGPFRGWGGGIGISMQKLNGRLPNYGDSGRSMCIPPAAGAAPIPHSEVCPPLDAEYAVSVAALDVSTFDGVSFWARRGPDSQVGIRVNVGDKYTDDDLSYLTYRQDPTKPRYCERVRQCSCGNHKSCVYKDPATCGDMTPDYYCDPPDPNGLLSVNSFNAPGSVNTSVSSGAMSGGGSSVVCTPFGVSSTTPSRGACNKFYPAYQNDALDGTYTSDTSLGADPQFFGRPCTNYAFPDGTGAGYCYDPAKDPPPAPGSQLCGDHWMTTVSLGTDWQFFKVPFSDLRQQGWAKKSDHLDLHSVSVVRFTWDVGWIDYWIDDLSFYRNPK